MHVNLSASRNKQRVLKSNKKKVAKARSEEEIKGKETQRKQET